MKLQVAMNTVDVEPTLEGLYTYLEELHRHLRHEEQFLRELRDDYTDKGTENAYLVARAQRVITEKIMNNALSMRIKVVERQLEGQKKWQEILNKRNARRKRSKLNPSL